MDRDYFDGSEEPLLGRMSLSEAKVIVKFREYITNDVLKRRAAGVIHRAYDEAAHKAAELESLAEWAEGCIQGGRNGVHTV